MQLISNRVLASVCVPDQRGVSTLQPRIGVRERHSHIRLNRVRSLHKPGACELGGHRRCGCTTFLSVEFLRPGNVSLFPYLSSGRNNACFESPLLLRNQVRRVILTPSHPFLPFSAHIVPGHAEHCTCSQWHVGCSCGTHVCAGISQPLAALAAVSLLLTAPPESCGVQAHHVQTMTSTPGECCLRAL